MSYFILGDPDLPQAIDAEAVKSVQMRKNRGVYQLLFFSASGVMLGLYAVQRVSDAGVERSDADYKRLADDEFRKTLEILKSEKPKSRQEFHNYAGFEMYLDVDVNATQSDSDSQDAGTSTPEPDKES